MITRRVHGRQFRLRPDPATNQIIAYVAAVFSEKYNIPLYAICALSNHWHPCTGDPDGNIVAFTRDTHSFIARATNCTYGDFESLWSSSQTSRVSCAQPQDLVRRIAYAMANPVEAGLVKYGKNWPGIRKCWPCKPMTIKRPPKFFRGPKDGGKWPDEVTLRFSRPPGYEDLSDDDLAALIEGAIDEREQELRSKAEQAGKQFLGRRNVLRQSRKAFPSTRAPRFGMSPRVGALDKWRRIEAIQRNRRWQRDYDAALKEWRAGNRDVVFPYGTHKMRLVHGVRCAPPPD